MRATDERRAPQKPEGYQVTAADILSKYLYSDVLPFTSTWKGVKDAPNHVPMNTIGLAHTSCEIFKDSDVPIFPVVLITTKALRPSV